MKTMTIAMAVAMSPFMAMQAQTPLDAAAAPKGPTKPFRPKGLGDDFPADDDKSNKCRGGKCR